MVITNTNQVDINNITRKLGLHYTTRLESFKWSPEAWYVIDTLLFRYRKAAIVQLVDFLNKYPNTEIYNYYSKPAVLVEEDEGFCRVDRIVEGIIRTGNIHPHHEEQNKRNGPITEENFLLPLIERINHSIKYDMKSYLSPENKFVIRDKLGLLDE